MKYVFTYFTFTFFRIHTNSKKISQLYYDGAF